MREIRLKAQEEFLPKVTSFVNETLQAGELSSELQMQIRLVVEEIFVNIASYAYTKEGKDDSLYGMALIECERTKNPNRIVIRFTDAGIPFDPLKEKDADTSGQMFREQEGGFGIYMAKQCMDLVEYEYKDLKNILTLTKYL